MFEFNAVDSNSADGLFLERLDTFMDKSLADIRAFSERELRPFEETRRHVAEWHSKYLFQSPSESASLHSLTNGDKESQVRSVLCEASRILESLSATAGVQSFLLAVNPTNPDDEGFLGGSLAGREFWRGLRGGGEPGARFFKQQCIRDLDTSCGNSATSGAAGSKKPSAAQALTGGSKALKNELYEKFRKALRSVCGIRNAEMKWTNPERLDAYGVRLVGWPSEIPAQNPSSLKQGQNRKLLDLLENGTLKFEVIFGAGPSGQSSGHTDDHLYTTANPDGEAVDDFSWAYDADGGASSPSMAESTPYHEVPRSRSSSVVPMRLSTPGTGVPLATPTVRWSHSPIGTKAKERSPSPNTIDMKRKRPRTEDYDVTQD